MQFLKDNKDFITSGLDLISFLIVTPEIIRLLRPSIGAVFMIVTYAAIFATYIAVVFLSGSLMLLIAMDLHWVTPVYQRGSWSNRITSVIVFVSIALGIGLAKILINFDVVKFAKVVSSGSLLTLVSRG